MFIFSFCCCYFFCISFYLFVNHLRVFAQTDTRSFFLLFFVLCLLAAQLPPGGSNAAGGAPKTVGGCCVPLGLPQPLLLEEKKFLLAVERGDIPNVRRWVSRHDVACFHNPLPQPLAKFAPFVIFSFFCWYFKWCVKGHAGVDGPYPYPQPYPYPYSYPSAAMCVARSGNA